MYSKGTLATTGVSGAAALPFTGFNILAYVVIAFTLIFAGMALKRTALTAHAGRVKK